MKREPKNIAASIQSRLLQRSRDLNVEHQLTLARFGGERLLYRLSKSEFADRFILKGAALLLLWMGDATLGENLILLVNLAGSAWLDASFLRRQGPFAALERWQLAYLPVYSVWAALVVIMFPPLSGYR